MSNTEATRRRKSSDGLCPPLSSRDILERCVCRSSAKEFAEMATKTKFPAFCFSYLDGKVSKPLDWVWSMPNDKVLEQLDKLASG